jgi:processive 1,2-diacylglycerol beta-glucosyltransferase
MRSGQVDRKSSSEKRRTPASVLILSSSGGAGHFRAGEALHLWAQQSFPNIHSAHYDALDFTTPSFKRIYGATYLAAVKRIPKFWGAMYNRLDHPQEKKALPVRIFDHFNYSSYVKMLNTLSPDAVLCTHFLPYLAIEGRKKGVRPNIPFFVVGTDFNLHSVWSSRSIRKYFVFSDETAALLSAKGVDANRIESTGIPVMPEFSVRQKTGSVRQLLGMPKNRFTLLILSGGYGVGEIEKIVTVVRKTLNGIRSRSFTLAVVCGRNEALAKKLRRSRVRDNVRLHVSGFIDNMHDYMAAADLLVSKSGGLTMSEALASRLPAIIVDPIPGQERLNADMLVEGGSALLALDDAQLSFKVDRAVRNDAWRRSAARAAGKLGKPYAARSILRSVLRTVQT